MAEPRTEAPTWRSPGSDAGSCSTYQNRRGRRASARSRGQLTKRPVSSGHPVMRRELQRVGDQLTTAPKGRPGSGGAGTGVHAKHPTGVGGRLGHFLRATRRRSGHSRAPCALYPCAQRELGSAWGPKGPVPSGWAVSARTAASPQPRPRERRPGWDQRRAGGSGAAGALR